MKKRSLEGTGVAPQDAAGAVSLRAPFDGLAGYYAHLYDMAKGYVKDLAQREEQLRIVAGWQHDAVQLGQWLDVR